MKKILVLAIGLLFLFTAFANAELVDNGDGTITDTDAGLMWMKDANAWYTSGQYYTGESDYALMWAGGLSFAGYDDWRLPSAYNQDGS